MRDLDWSNVVADGEAAADVELYEYHTLAEALEALEVSRKDVLGDNPGLSEDDVMYDLVSSVAQDSDAEVGRELCRTQLGFVPPMLHWEE